MRVLRSEKNAARKPPLSSYVQDVSRWNALQLGRVTGATAEASAAHRLRRNRRHNQQIAVPGARSTRTKAAVACRSEHTVVHENV